MTNLIKNINEAQNFIYSRGDFEEGLKSAQKAYKLRPDNLEAIYIYAIALYFNDDYKKALELFHILENANKYLDCIYVYIAHCYSYLKENLFTGLKYINKAIKIYHYDEETTCRALLIKAEIEYKLGNIDIALNHFLQAHRLGDSDKSLCYISQIYFEKNQILKALKYFYKIFKNTNLNVKDLNLPEIKSMILVLVDRYEIEENKHTFPQEILDSVNKKIYS